MTEFVVVMLLLLSFAWIGRLHYRIIEIERRFALQHPLLWR